MTSHVVNIPRGRFFDPHARSLFATLTDRSDPFTTYNKNNLAYIFFITLTFFYHLITEFHLHILNTTIALSVCSFFILITHIRGVLEEGSRHSHCMREVVFPRQNIFKYVVGNNLVTDSNNHLHAVISLCYIIE